MKILFAMTYYRPHVSGVTVYIERLSAQLARRGHEVAILTSQYREDLPLGETQGGVRIIRVPVAFRISKGAIMPSYARLAWPLIKEHDVLAINLPSSPTEAVLAPLLAKAAGRPVTATYHCDVQLPRGFLNRVVDAAVFLDNLVAGCLVDRIVAYTDDYANFSRVLSRFRGKRTVIPPPIQVADCTEEDVAAFRARYSCDGETIIGFPARFATEKGVEFLLNALPLIARRVPSVRILFAGDYQSVIGEDAYWNRLQPLLDCFKSQWTFLGILDPPRMAAFYRACDVTVLPSINRTESFGLVQVESMLCGTPVVASDLPGVRVSIRTTGMGRIVPIMDSPALADAIVDVVRNRESYMRSRAQIEEHFSMGKTVREYERLFEMLIGDNPHA